MEEFESELKISFLEEADQLLADVEKCYLDLESTPNDISLLDQIFRVAHNLKGSAKAVGFLEVGQFAHQFENLLLKLKNGEIAINPAIVSVLLRSNDHLTLMIRGLRENLSATFDSSALIILIDQALEGKLTEDDVGPNQVEFEEDAPTELSPQVMEPFLTDKPDFSYRPDLDSDIASQTASSNTEHDLVVPAPTPSSENRLEEVPIKTLNPLQAEEAAVNESDSIRTNRSEKSSEPPPPAPKSPPASSGTTDESIRVSLSRLEKLLNYVGEMVILQTVLKEQAQSSNDLLRKTVHQLGKVTKEVQDISMSLRMVPLKATFLKMQRIVRDTSMELNKKVTLQLQGEDTELDKTILERVSDPLVHLIRNACDHGIESSDLRKTNGKNEMGTIRLSAYHQNGKLVIEVADDGGGINPEVLRRKAIEKKIISASTSISDQEAIKLIFHPGFSTKAVVTDVSGRGVGMDVVKHNIESLQGEVLVETQLSKGTTFKIILPLTLAIIDAMIVTISDSRYVVPLSHVHESVKLDSTDIKQTTGLGEVLLLRGETVPLFRLSNLVGRKTKSSTTPEQMIAIVAKTASESFAVLVDDIIGQYQVVIKQLGSELQNIRGFSGSSILGDGKPALILELAELVARAKGPHTNNARGVAA